MPRLSDIMTATRGPLAQALVDQQMAQADLNGMLTALALGRPGYDINDLATRDKLAKAIHRAHDARHALDEAAFAAIDVHMNGSKPLCTNDPDDLLDACITRLERNHYGSAPDNAFDPDYANDIARADLSAPVTGTAAARAA